MTNEEVRRLLGGYATNSLNEVERKALFDAALEDQELFDALEDEQALKDLLDDQITRGQVRAALQGNVEMGPRAWRGRWWTWSLAGVAAAALTIALIVKVNTPAVSRQQVEMAMANKPASAMQAAPAPASTPARPPSPSEMMARLARREREKKVEGRRSAKEELTHTAGDRKDMAADAQALLPPPPAVAERQAAGQSEQSALQLQKSQQALPQLAQAPLPAPAASNTIRDQGAAAQPRSAAVTTGALGGAIGGFAGAPAPLKAGVGLSYSVLKRDQSGEFSKVDSNAAVRRGDAVRLMVSPSTSGYLNLYERDSSGAWQPVRLAPSKEDGVRVNANTQYVVPEQPIDVKEQEQLRLVLSPEPVTAAAISKPEARAKTSAKRAIEIQPQRPRHDFPITVDITLTGKRE
jgi:hypothetical protein